MKLLVLIAFLFSFDYAKTQNSIHRIPADMEIVCMDTIGSNIALHFIVRIINNDTSEIRIPKYYSATLSDDYWANIKAEIICLNNGVDSVITPQIDADIDVYPGFFLETVPVDARYFYLAEIDLLHFNTINKGKYKVQLSFLENHYFKSNLEGKSQWFYFTL